MSYADYAWALNKLRREGINPTLEAIYSEIRNRGENPSSPTPEPARLPTRPLPPVATTREPLIPSPVTQLAAPSLALRERLAEAHQRIRELEASLREANSATSSIPALKSQAEKLGDELRTAREESSLLAARAKLLAGEIESLRAQSSLSEDWKARHDEATARLAELETQLDEAQVEVALNHSLEDVIREQKLSLEASGQRAESLSRQLEEVSERAARIDDLESRLIVATSAADSLRKQLHAWQEKFHTEQAARSRIEEEVRELQSRAQNAPEHSAEAEQLAAQNRLLSEQIESLARNEASLLEKLRRESEETSRLAGRLNAAVLDARSRENQLLESLRDANRKIETARSLRSELDAAQATIADLRQRGQSLSSEIEELRHTAAELDRHRIESGRNKSEIASLKAREEELLSTIESLRDTASEIPRLREELELSRAQIASLEGRQEALLASSDSLRESLEANSRLRQELDERDARLVELTAATEKLHAEIDAANALSAHSEALRAETTRLHQEVAALQSRENDLREKLAAAESDSREAEALRADLDAATRELTHLRETAARDEAALRAAEEAAALSAPLQAELDRLRSTLADTREQNERLVGQLDASVKSLGESTNRSPRFLAFGLAAGLAAIAAAAIFLVSHYYPGIRDLQENSAAMNELRLRNDHLVTELDKTLLRIQSAKESELSLERMRTMESQLTAANDKLAGFEKEWPANLARMTRLQSDLDLARSRLQRLSTELASRDLRILELERLLGQIGDQATQISPTPPMSLVSPGIGPSLLGLTDPNVQRPETIEEVTTNSVNAVQRQAEEAFKDRNHALAEILFQRVADASPNNHLALSNLAAVQLELGKLSLAKDNIRRALDIKPDDAFALTTLGVIEIKNGRTDAAYDALLRSAELDSHAADTFNYLGVVFDLKGDRTRAIEEIQKAIKLSPAYAEAHFNLAVLHAQGDAGEKELAKSHYERALQLGAAPDPELDRSLR